MGARDSANIKSNRLVQSYPRKKAKSLDISSEKICLRKNGKGQQLCFQSFIFSQTLTQIFAFLPRIFPHVCQLCVAWRPIYIAARSTDRASERARAFYPTPVVLYLRKKSERVSFSLPSSPFPNVFMSPSSFPLFSDISDFCTLEDLSSLSRNGKLACSSSLSPPGV